MSHTHETTEHLVNYTYNGSTRTMVVKKSVTEYEKLFAVRTQKGEVILQFYDYRWNVISTVKMRYELAQCVGEAISDAGLI